MNIPNFKTASVDNYIAYPMMHKEAKEKINKGPDSEFAHSVRTHFAEAYSESIEIPERNIPINFNLVHSWHDEQIEIEKGNMFYYICFHVGDSRVIWGYNHFEDYKKDMQTLNAYINPLSPK